MNLYYVTQWDNNESGIFPGPAKKINDQLFAFQSFGYNVKLCNNKLDAHSNNPGIMRKITTGIYTRLPFTETLKTKNCDIIRLPNVSKIVDADIIYIRFWWGDFTFRNCIDSLRRQNPTAIILLEFPDYPYRSKEVGIKNLHLYLKDRNCSRIYAHAIDYMVTLAYVKEIYGVPAIHMYNGINVSKLRQRIPNTRCPSVINLGFVATVQHSHGIDRLIEGIREYYSNNEYPEQKVVLHIAGGGVVYDHLQSLMDSYKLNNYVKFYGYVYNKDLDVLYDNIDIGVDYLAPHRDGITISSSLKTREYMARGIPIVTGAYLDICEDKGVDFFYKVESSETPIDVQSIINFANKVYTENPLKVISRIREFAVKNIDIKETMSFIKNLHKRKLI